MQTFDDVVMGAWDYTKALRTACDPLRLDRHGTVAVRAYVPLWLAARLAETDLECDLHALAVGALPSELE